MTRYRTLHAPYAGIRLAWPIASPVVVDPGPDEHARRRNIARERYLVTGAVVLTMASLVLLLQPRPQGGAWEVAALLLGSLMSAAARPGRRVVPASLVDLLDSLRATLPTRSGEIHRLVWEASDLIAASARPDTPSCPDCERRIEQISARLHVLTTPQPWQRRPTNPTTSESSVADRIFLPIGPRSRQASLGSPVAAGKARARHVEARDIAPGPAVRPLTAHQRGAVTADRLVAERR